MPLKVRVRAKIQLTFLDYLLQELVVVRGGVQVYQPSLLKSAIKSLSMALVRPPNRARRYCKKECQSQS